MAKAFPVSIIVAFQNTCDNRWESGYWKVTGLVAGGPAGGNGIHRQPLHAVTEGTDAQATVSVRMEEDGRIVTGQSANTDTVVASALAYIHALNRLLVRREKGGKDTREISYKDVS